MADLKIPQIGEYVRSVGKLLRVEVIPPEPVAPQCNYIFEDRDAKCELRFNGEVIKSLQTLCDFYGFGTGEESAIQEMKQYAQDKGITKDSDLEVVVIRVIKQIGRVITSGTNYSAKEYVNFEYAPNFPSRKGLEEDVETIVWSSKNNG